MTDWERPRRTRTTAPVLIVVAAVALIAAVLARPSPDPPQRLVVDDAGSESTPRATEPAWTPPVPGRWRLLPGAPLQPRIAHTTVWTGDRLFVWGGFNSGARPLTDGALFDPTTGTWQALPDLDLAATAEQAAVVGRHIVVLSVTAAAAYDTERGRWEALNAPPVPSGHTLADQVISTGSIAAVLTVSRTSSQPAVLVLDLDTGWRRLPDPPVSYVAGDLLLAAGGRIELYSQPTADRPAAVHGLDPADGRASWQRLNAPVELHHQQVVRIAGTSRGQRTVLWVTTPRGESSYVAVRVNRRWRRLPPPPLPATNHVDVLDAGASVVLWDRRAAQGAVLDGDGRRWTVLPPPPVSDAVPQPAVWTGDSIIIWGGLTAGGASYRPER